MFVDLNINFDTKRISMLNFSIFCFSFNKRKENKIFLCVSNCKETKIFVRHMIGTLRKQSTCKLTDRSYAESLISISIKHIHLISSPHPNAMIFISIDQENQSSDAEKKEVEEDPRKRARCRQISTIQITYYVFGKAYTNDW